MYRKGRGERGRARRGRSSRSYGLSGAAEAEAGGRRLATFVLSASPGPPLSSSHEGSRGRDPFGEPPSVARLPTRGVCEIVVLKEGAELDDGLKKRISARIREECSPRHVPNDVFAVPEIPKTLNGKKLEVPVKKILSGTPPEEAASRDSLANPESLDRFAELAQRIGLLDR